MTELADLVRGDVIWATDPLSEKGRPMLILSTPRFQSHGVQLITVPLSTKTYHEDAVELRDRDYDGEPLDERSFVLPWSLATLNGGEAVSLHLTSLADERTDDVTEQSVGYISS